LAAATLGAIAYGINIPAARAAGIAGLSGPNLIAIRGVALLVILLVIARLAVMSLAVPSGARGKLLALGVSAAGTALCYLSSINFVPVAVAVTLFYTFPLWLILMAPFFGGGSIAGRQIVVFVLAFAGILMCVGPGFGALDWRGVAFALFASLMCAVLFQLMPLVKAERFAIVFWSQLTVTAVAIPWTLLAELPSIEVLVAAAVPVAISSVGFYAGFAMQIFAATLISPATAGLIFLFEPVIAILLAALVLGESLRPVQIAGIALVIGVLATDLWMKERQGERVANGG
jgi:drug/metabolite transporter (DMT)-like permease